MHRNPFLYMRINEKFGYILKGCEAQNWHAGTIQRFFPGRFPAGFAWKSRLGKLGYHTTGFICRLKEG